MPNKIAFKINSLRLTEKLRDGPVLEPEVDRRTRGYSGFLYVNPSLHSGLGRAKDEVLK